jgi:SAM-dependent methyltransferase
MLKTYSARREQLRAWAEHDATIYGAFTRTVEQAMRRPLPTLRFLDLGCGSNAPMTLLLHGMGCKVTGVDAVLGHRWGLGFSPNRYRSYLREAGLAKTLRKLAGELTFDSVYYDTLARAAGVRLTEDGLDLRAMDVTNPQLPDSMFDVIHSNATWEHVKDVDAANRTVANALRPGGIAYIEIHLFPSLSGGHDLPWITPGRTVLGDVKPWQHLRRPDWKAPVFLNRLRERDYRRSFEGTPGLSILEWRTEFTEGEDLLTSEILQELKDYEPEELTRRSIVVVARRD